MPLWLGAAHFTATARRSPARRLGNPSGPSVFANPKAFSFMLKPPTQNGLAPWFRDPCLMMPDAIDHHRPDWKTFAEPPQVFRFHVSVGSAGCNPQIIPNHWMFRPCPQCFHATQKLCRTGPKSYSSWPVPLAALAPARRNSPRTAALRSSAARGLGSAPGTQNWAPPPARRSSRCAQPRWSRATESTRGERQADGGRLSARGRRQLR